MDPKHIDKWRRSEVIEIPKYSGQEENTENITQEIEKFKDRKYDQESDQDREAKDKGDQETEK